MLEIVERAKAIAVKQLFVEPDQVVEAASLIDDLGLIAWIWQSSRSSSSRNLGFRSPTRLPNQSGPSEMPSNSSRDMGRLIGDRFR